jgi:hypothetical protein
MLRITLRCFHFTTVHLLPLRITLHCFHLKTVNLQTINLIPLFR